MTSSHKQSETQTSSGSGQAASQPSARIGHPEPQPGLSDKRTEPRPCASGKPDPSNCETDPANCETDPSNCETDPANRKILRIGIVSISDRASKGVYEDRGLPALRAWLEAAIVTAFHLEERLIPDERAAIEANLRSLCDQSRCHLILTTGGTGPSRRDVTPEATLAVSSREMPGFGEQMRQISLRFVPTAILSRQVAALRELVDGHSCLIVNLPGQPKAIAETLAGLKDNDGHVLVPGIFAAVPYCLDLIGAPRLETEPTVCKAFRPKSV